VRKHILMLLILLLVVSPVFARDESQIPVSKKHDFSFSLSGGIIGGKFNLAGDFLYAQEFKGNLFLQTAAFVNNKEAGGSFGLGSFSDTGDLYLFIDSLYSYGKLWTQLRPTARLRFSWMSLTAFYAFPITKSTIQVDNEKVGAVDYWGGEVNMVPVSWARVYGNLLSIDKIYTYKFGAEVRLIKWLSISADWNKTDPGLFARWSGYRDFRISVNFLLGSQQQGFEPIHRSQLASMYPVLVFAKESGPKPPEVWAGEVEFMYQRIFQVTKPSAPDLTKGAASIYNPGLGGKNSSLWQLAGENKWTAVAYMQSHFQEYYISVLDLKVANELVAEKLFARIKGNTVWVELTCVVQDPLGQGKAAKLFLTSDGKIQVPFS